jgi:hypothetical protein
MPWVDDTSINDEVTLWRRVNQSMFSEDSNGRTVLTSFAFKSPDDELSMDVSTETTAETVLSAGYPTQTIVGIKAGVLRKLGYIIARDPVPNNPAHVLVVPTPGKSQKQKHLDRQTMAQNATWE